MGRKMAKIKRGLGSIRGSIGGLTFSKYKTTRVVKQKVYHMQDGSGGYTFGDTGSDETEVYVSYIPEYTNDTAGRFGIVSMTFIPKGDGRFDTEITSGLGIKMSGTIFKLSKSATEWIVSTTIDSTVFTIVLSRPETSDEYAICDKVIGEFDNPIYAPEFLRFKFKINGEPWYAVRETTSGAVTNYVEISEAIVYRESYKTTQASYYTKFEGGDFGTGTIRCKLYKDNNTTQIAIQSFSYNPPNATQLFVIKPSEDYEEDYKSLTFKASSSFSLDEDKVPYIKVTITDTDNDANYILTYPCDYSWRDQIVTIKLDPEYKADTLIPKYDLYFYNDDEFAKPTEILAG